MDPVDHFDLVREILEEKIRSCEQELMFHKEQADERWNSDRRAIDKAEVGIERALVAAKTEAEERLRAHNGLIEQMRQQAESHEKSRIREAAQFARTDVVEAIQESLNIKIETGDKALDTEIKRLDKFQSKIVGGLTVVAAIGLANFVHIWLS